MGKPGGSGNATVKPKYEGPTINVAGMDYHDMADVAGYVGARTKQTDKMADWAGRLVVGRDAASLKAWGNGSWGWDVVVDYGNSHPEIRAAVDAWIAFRQA